MIEKKGILNIVATPIGNLEDITFRAVRVLREADLVAAEDTRTAIKLLNRYEIRKPLISLYRHNTERRLGEILRELEAGKSVAVISECGTPTVSDPGVEVVGAAIAAGFKVCAIPGPSSVTAALSISGFPADRFLFAGFLPRKRGKRIAVLKRAAETGGAVVILESPYRVLETLRDIREVFGNGAVAVGRELTKIHEELRRGSVDEIIRHYESVAIRGEFTIVIGPAARRETSSTE